MTTNAIETRRIATGIDICIRCDSLVLENISNLLGVKPTSGFEKGESYVGRQKCGSEIVNVNRVRPHGVWHFCTSESLRSKNVEEHARLLIDTLAPAKSEIKRLIDDPDHYVKITIWVLGYTFDLAMPCLAALSSLAESLTITCWDDDEDDPD